MKKSKLFTMAYDAEFAQALEKLSSKSERSKASVVRILVKQAAQQFGKNDKRNQRAVLLY